MVMNRNEKTRIGPSGSTRFGRYLKQRGISDAEAATALGFTRSYIQMLRTGAATPGLKTASAIRKWSKGEVAFESWLEAAG